MYAGTGVLACYIKEHDSVVGVTVRKARVCARRSGNPMIIFTHARPFDKGSDTCILFLISLALSNT